ncbi:copper amine oxidase N-terminal domain-containing protein [Paenibacillus sp. y28]|uniref:copper amine oxidase N-terminal domain-containing protein n=1 Tax=Paenibacillus sp. y28 TaxID=3129110 RepID=UPI00301689F0
MNKLQSYKPKHKRVLKWAAALLVISSIGGTVYAAERQAEYMGFPVVGLEVNGQAVQNEVPAINMNGSTMVPLRFVSESLGATVDWNKETSTAVILAATPSPAPAPASSGGNNGSGTAADPNRELIQQVTNAYENLYIFAGRLKDMKVMIDMTYEQTVTYKNNAYLFKLKNTYLNQLRKQHDNMLDQMFKAQEASKKLGHEEPLLAEMDKLNVSLRGLESLSDFLSNYADYNKAIDDDWFSNYLATSYDVALENSFALQDKYLEWSRKTNAAASSLK